QAGGGGGVAGLGERVLDEAGVRLFGLADAEHGLRDDLDAERGEQGLHLGGLLGVVAGEDESGAHDLLAPGAIAPCSAHGGAVAAAPTGVRGTAAGSSA